MQKNSRRDDHSVLLRKAFLPLLICLQVLCACSISPDNQLIKASKNFDKVYKDIIKDIDTNDLDGMLAILESDINAKKFDELKSIITEVEKIEPSEKLSQLKVNVIKKYDNIFFLIDSLKNFDILTDQERRKVDYIRVSIEMDKND